ncbi:MAG TPA: hypothetical protein VN520_16315 [Streptomyces sp.]|uniref:dihydrofolate reductase family protein n=1 Tax=Streptomyces sp. TaxID=1931 RepID=UPI002BB6A5EB|nr:hypothetical protein [Streptomyces sp.]HWU07921.1 hypothetical protein [Streptomyces sp.]
MMPVSLDGFFEGPDRDLGRHLADEEVHRNFDEQMGTVSAFPDGRVTYELMAGFRPTADSDPSNPPVVAEFSEIRRNMPKFVFSGTLDRADWNTAVVRDVVVEDIRALQAQPGGEVGQLRGPRRMSRPMRLRPLPPGPAGSHECAEFDSTQAAGWPCSRVRGFCAHSS